MTANAGSIPGTYLRSIIDRIEVIRIVGDKTAIEGAVGGDGASRIIAVLQGSGTP